MRRFAFFWLIASALCVASAARALPPSTPTRTATWTALPQQSPTSAMTPTATETALPTLTGTPLPVSRIKPELIEWPSPAPTPPATPSCVLVLRLDNLLPECIPLNNGSLGGGPWKCPTVSIAAATESTICVTWDTAFSSAGAYSVLSSIDDVAGTIAALFIHHVNHTASGACAVLMNSDAAVTHTGTLCLEALPHP